MAKILVVDDNVELAENMRDFLSAQDHTVELAHCGQDAYQALGNSDFDLLILDWELPDANGPEICKGYRDRGGMGAVLLLTGRSSSNDKVVGLTAGADDYLTKPFNIAEFGARVIALLRRALLSKPAEPQVFDETMVGKTFAGAYKIESVLGTGGMGIVYAGRHKTLERHVAIKVLSARNMGVAARKRFEREAKAMSLLDHDNLIKIYEFGLLNNDVPYIVMEQVDGTPLNVVIGECGCLPAKYAVPLFIQIAEGMEHAHAQNIIHRDLKPSNIILSNTAKILDLGVAKINESEDVNDDKLTFAGEIFGSPGYMSPEQGTNKELDQRTDVYSLGCLMFEVLTGEMPFFAYSFVELINIKQNSKPPSICEKKPELRFPPELDRLIQRCMEPDLNKRIASMTELKLALQKMQAVLEPGDKVSQSKFVPFLKNLLGKKD